jgi:prepilin-type N-terminal cleavage/methylation domain-containing protein
MKTVHKQGLTLIELTVVLLIVSILSSIAIGIYTTFTQRARVARAHAEVNELSLAVARYQSDLGTFPPSRSLDSVAGSLVFIPYTNFGLIPGNGWLMLALMRGVVGTPAGVPTGAMTTDPLWRGPYIDARQDQLLDFHTGAAITSVTLPANVCLSDPWGKPYSYVNSNDYVGNPSPGTLGATVGGLPFPGFFNPSTYQIYSAGPNGLTPVSPSAGLGADDIRNF